MDFLAQHLSMPDSTQAQCAGHIERFERFSPLAPSGYGYGLICSNAAVRVLYPYLEQNCVLKAMAQYNLFLGDRIVIQCLHDLRIPYVPISSFAGGDTRPEWLGHWRRYHNLSFGPAVFHKTTTDQDFDLLERLWFNSRWSTNRLHQMS